jgi:4-amino-4-deoxy-L-arabinose transferase-like glycosyltransferase
MLSEPTKLDANDGWVPPALLAMLASIVVLPRLGSFGLWADEGFSVSTSLRSWSELAHLSVTKESNGVLYAAFLKLWAIGGISEFWLRLPSALAFVVTASLTWFLGRRLHSSTAGVCAGVLVCLHGSLLEYGQNVRFYAPVVMTGVAFVLCVHRLCEYRTPGRFAAVSILGVCLPLLHLVAGLLLFAAAVVLLMCSRVRKVSSLVTSLLCLVPGVVIMGVVGALVSSRNEGQSINQPLGIAAAFDVVYSLTGSAGKLGAVAYALLSVLALVTLRTSFQRSSIQRSSIQRSSRFDSLVVWIVLVVCLTGVTAGSLVTTLMVGRYVLFLVPFLAVAVSIGVTTAITGLAERSSSTQRRLGGVVLPLTGPQPWSGSRVIRVGAVSLVVLLGVVGSVAGAVNWLTMSDREQWRPLAAAMLADSKTADGVLFANDSIRLFVEYELRRRPERLATVPQPVFPQAKWGDYRTGDQQYLPFTEDDFRKAIATYPTVWLVVERPLVDKPFPALTKVLSAYMPTQTRSFGRSGTLYRFDRSG